MGTTHFSAEVGDIETRWRELSADESAVAAVLLEDADLKLYVRRPQLPAAIASTDPAVHVDGRLAKIVLSDMVFRVLVNPDSFRNTTVGADGTVSAGYFGIEILRARVALASGDLDEIDRSLRDTGQALSVVRSRRTVNTDYGTGSSTGTLPTP
jgi:hypothetical protein